MWPLPITTPQSDLEIFININRERVQPSLYKLMSIFCAYSSHLLSGFYFLEQYQDRVRVYQILNDHGIETPRYIVCDRSDLNNLPEFEEFDDYLEINGETFHKPFVEKPVSAENHRTFFALLNTNIFYGIHAKSHISNFGKPIHCSPVSSIIVHAENHTEK